MQYKGTFEFAEYTSPPNTATGGLSSGTGTSETTGRIVRLSAAQIAAPTAAILADTTATYIGPNNDRLHSNGTALVRVSPEVHGSQPALLNSKITTKNGTLRVGGIDYRGVFINAVDLFFDFLQPFAITAVTQANPGVITSAAHGLNVNEPVYLSSIGGMTQLAGYYLVNTVPLSTTFTVKTLAGVPVNTTGFSPYTSGGQVQRSWFTQDLPTIASYGVKLIRVSLGHVNNTTTWTNTIGTNGAAPNANLLVSLRIFLDACAANNIGVELCMFWGYATVPAVLAATVVQYQTPGSASRAYMTNLASFLAKNLFKHPALAAYNIGNEWFDIASLAQFATVATDVNIDHLKFLADICTEVVAALRLWDNDRAVIAPHGTNGRFDGGQVQEFIRKWLYSAGTCDIVAFHMYPDTDRSGFAHGFVGADLGGAGILVSMLRNAALQANKVLVVDECGAEDDATAYSGQPVGTVSISSYNKAFGAGCELVADWSWYVTPALGAGGASDLKTTRLAAMTQITTYNAGLSGGFVVPPSPYPIPGTFNVPNKWARGSGAVGGHITVPFNQDFSPAPAANAKLWNMFWFRKLSAFGTNPRIISCDNGTNGYILTLSVNEGLQWQMCLGAAYNLNTVLSAFNYPSNMEADPSKGYVGEPHHIAWFWDGSLNTALGADNSQHFTLWIDGLVAGRITTTSKQALGYTDRALFLLSNSDGSGANANAEIGDSIWGKGTDLTTSMVVDYLMNGTVPSSALHRYKLESNAADSIGSLHGTAGAGITFVANRIGR